MKVIKKITVGSSLIVDEPRDVDRVWIVEDLDEVHKWIEVDGQLKFVFKNIDGGELFDWYMLECNSGIKTLSLLSPEFLEHFKLTIFDVKPIMDKFSGDMARAYGEVMYKFYLENGEPKLTSEQLDVVRWIHRDHLTYEEIEFMGLI